MVAGGLVLAVAAWRLPAELKKDPKSPQATAVSSRDCVGAPCRANDDRRPARGYEVPSVVVDPTNELHQVVGDMNLVGGKCGWHTTFDGGKSWLDGEFTVPAEFGLCALDSAGLLPMGNVVMSANGQTVYAPFAARKTGLHGEKAGDGGDGILMVTSTDGGRTFDAARPILPGASVELAYVRPQMTITTSGDGVDHLMLSVWGCVPGRCTKGFFLRSDDNGKTFTAPVLITPDPGGNSPSPPVLAADGTIYMTFLRRYQGDVAELLVARSGDDGKTFDAVVVDKQPAIGIQYDSAKIAVDPKRGWLYMTWADQRDARSEVFFRRSQDKGVSWEPIVRLKTSPGGSSLSPAMSIAPDGRIEIVFYRETRKNIQEVHATYSTDGGKTFALDEKLNGKTINRDLGYWAEVGDDSIPAVAATATGAVFAWSDTRDATEVTDTQEILTKQVTRPAP